MANTWILIRHPDKEGDKEGLYLGELAEITELGVQQMKLAAARLKLMGPTAITCSMFPRAITLAEHLAEDFGLEVPLKTSLLNEIDKPQFLRGLKRTDPLHVDVMQAIRDGWNANTVPTDLLRGEKIRSRSEVEEDIARLFSLVEQFQTPNADPETDVLLSVSHAKTIAAIGQWVLGNGSLLNYYEQADRVFRVSTTGITILKRGPFRRDQKIQWEIATWNEESHTEIGLDEEFRALLKDIE